FTDDMVDLVLDAEGNLKAEHGTGRAMAPFVRRQYGGELYEVMQELKKAIDPRGILNPGVILDEDPTAHISNVKLNPTVEAEIDPCVECGYCEPVCPSKDLTLTPRQRIVVRRARAKAEQEGDTATVAELDKDYEYMGKQTCAVDSLCVRACPVDIDTGKFIKQLRREDSKKVEQKVWKGAASGWSAVNRGASIALTGAYRLPTGLARPSAILAERWWARRPCRSISRSFPQVACAVPSSAASSAIAPRRSKRCTFPPVLMLCSVRKKAALVSPKLSCACCSAPR